MSRIKYLLAITALLFSQHSFAAAYEDDPQRFMLMDNRSTMPWPQ